MGKRKFVITRGVAVWDGQRYVTESTEGYDYDGPWALALTRNPTYTTGQWRFYADTGNPGSSALAAVDTDATLQGATTKFRFRAAVGETNNANASNTGAWRLQAQVNGTGGYATVATGSGSCRAVSSGDAGFTDGNMSQLFTTITGSTYNTAFDEAETANATASQTWADDSTEYEWCLQCTGLVVGDYVEFQVLDPAGVVKTLSGTPRITLAALNTNATPDKGTGTFAGSIPSFLVSLSEAPGKGTGTFLTAGPTVQVHGPVKTGGSGLLLFGLNLEANGNVSRSPANGTGTFSGSAPTLAQTANQWIDIGAGSGTFSGSAPTIAVTAHQWIDTAAGAGTFSGSAPTVAVTQNQFEPLTAGSGTFAGSAPTLAKTENQWIDVGAGSGAFTGLQPVSQNGQSETSTPDVGSGAFSGSAPSPLRTENQWIDIGSGSLTGAGYAPVSVPTAHVWITPDSGSGAFSGKVPSPTETVAGSVSVPTGSATLLGYAPAVVVPLFITPGAGSGAFTGYAPTVSTPVVTTEESAGGWVSWIRYEQDLLRREEERRRLEKAIEAEIAARITGEEATPAEEAAPDYLTDLRLLIASAEREAEFRRFVEGLRLQQLESELARLLSIDRAIREYVRRRRDEEEFIQILLMAA